MEKKEQQSSYRASACSCKTTPWPTEKTSIPDDFNGYLNTLQINNYTNAKGQTLVQNDISFMILTEHHN